MGGFKSIMSEKVVEIGEDEVDRFMSDRLQGMDHEEKKIYLAQFLDIEANAISFNNVGCFIINLDDDDEQLDEYDYIVK